MLRSQEDRVKKLPAVREYGTEGSSLFNEFSTHRLALKDLSRVAARN
jgi:hypothetical protein